MAGNPNIEKIIEGILSESDLTEKEKDSVKHNLGLMNYGGEGGLDHALNQRACLKPSIRNREVHDRRIDFYVERSTGRFYPFGQGALADKIEYTKGRLVQECKFEKEGFSNLLSQEIVDMSTEKRISNEALNVLGASYDIYNELQKQLLAEREKYVVFCADEGKRDIVAKRIREILAEKESQYAFERLEADLAEEFDNDPEKSRKIIEPFFYSIRSSEMSEEARSISFPIDKGLVYFPKKESKVRK